MILLVRVEPATHQDKIQQSYKSQNAKMKRNIFLLCLTLLCSRATMAQLDKGTWLVGGSGSFYSYNENYATPTYSQSSKYTSVELAASIGYFVIDKFAVGLRPGYTSFKGEVVNTPGGTNQIKISVGPFGRYYLLNKDKPFNLLIDASYQIGTNKFLGGLREKGKNNTLSLMGGSEIFFNSSVGIEILLGYTSKVVSIDNSQSAFNNTKNGFQASVGFTFHLQKL